MIGLAFVVHKTFNTHYKLGHVERDLLRRPGNEGCPGVSVYTRPRLALGRLSLKRYQGARRGPRPLDWAWEILLSRDPLSWTDGQARPKVPGNNQIGWT